MANKRRAVTLGDVAGTGREKATGEKREQFQRYIEGGHMDSENLRITRWGDIGDGYLGPAFHRVFRKGQVLYGSRRTYLKKVAVADFDGITSATTYVIEAKSDGIMLPGLLPYVLLSDEFTAHSIRKSKGSVTPFVNWKDIASYEFFLPPLARQGELLAILQKCEECKTLVCAFIEQIGQLREAIIGNEFASQGKTAAFGELCELVKAIAHHPDSNLGVGGSSLIPQDIYALGELETLISSKLKFEEGDVLYGSIRPYLQKAHVAQSAGMCTPSVFVLRCAQLSPSVLATLLASKLFSGIAMNCCKGAKMPQVKWDALRQVQVPVSLIDNSRQFADKFDAIYRQISLLRDKYRLLKNLQMAIVSTL